jgi:hypothetical protein
VEAAGWWGVLLSGSLGAFIGTAASVLLALYVVSRQQVHERNLRLHDQRNTAALTLLSLTYGLVKASREVFDHYLADDDPGADAPLVNELYGGAEYAYALATFLDGELSNVYGRLREATYSVDDVLKGHRDREDYGEYVLDVYSFALDGLGSVREWLIASHSVPAAG